MINDSVSSVFKPCHGSVNPEKYHKACVFDSCMLPSMDLECSSLQTYALTCADQGVCIDWRSHTNGVCRKYLAIPLELLRRLLVNVLRVSHIAFWALKTLINHNSLFPEVILKVRFLTIEMKMSLQKYTSIDCAWNICISRYILVRRQFWVLWASAGRSHHI